MSPTASTQFPIQLTLLHFTDIGNLITSMHEFKYMGRTNDVNILERKCNQEAFLSAAGCLNRTVVEMAQSTYE